MPVDKRTSRLYLAKCYYESLGTILVHVKRSCAAASASVQRCNATRAVSHILPHTWNLSSHASSHASSSHASSRSRAHRPTMADGAPAEAPHNRGGVLVIGLISLVSSLGSGLVFGWPSLSALLKHEGVCLLQCSFRPNLPTKSCSLGCMVVGMAARHGRRHGC